MSLAKMFHATLFAGLRGLGFESRGSSALAQCWSLKLLVCSTARYAEKLPLFFFSPGQGFVYRLKVVEVMDCLCSETGVPIWLELDKLCTFSLYRAHGEMNCETPE
jgi:hypothetical protein